MPLVTVKVFERRLDAQSEARIIKAMTDALLDALEAEELRDHTWVLVEGYDPHRWGRGGKPWEAAWSRGDCAHGNSGSHRDRRRRAGRGPRRQGIQGRRR